VYVVGLLLLHRQDDLMKICRSSHTTRQDRFYLCLAKCMQAIWWMVTRRPAPRRTTRDPLHFYCIRQMAAALHCINLLFTPNRLTKQGCHFQQAMKYKVTLKTAEKWRNCAVRTCTMSQGTMWRFCDFGAYSCTTSNKTYVLRCNSNYYHLLTYFAVTFAKKMVI